MNKIRINQFHSGSAFGDAVTNSLIYTKKILEELGFESHIYCEHVALELSHEIEHYLNYKTNEDNILLLHHSMGHDLDEWILSLKDKIVLVYHNITPENFFSKESPFYHYSLKGREQLNMFKRISIGAIGDSKLNTDELLEYAFDEKRTKIIPLLIDFDKVKNHNWNPILFDENTKEFNILFVGRVAPNKGQYELIIMYKIFRELFTFPSKLYLVGGLSGDEYENKVRSLISEYNLEAEVILTGKVSYDDLYSYYRLSDVFVCLSEHEGFGVPLIESMIFDLPIVAYDSSNIRNTLNGTGILFKEKNLEYIAGFISLLAKNKSLRREIIKIQRRNLLNYQFDNIKYELAKFLNILNLTNINLDELNIIDDMKSITFQIEGPFDTSYSLALLNREMAKALNNLNKGDVALFSTEGPGDFKPNPIFLKKNEIYNEMWLKANKASTNDVVLRNLYPPRVYDVKGLINLTNSYGWEESSFPQEYLNDFNRYLDALPVMSNYVKKIMIDNGLSIPSKVVGVGVDHVLNISPKSLKIKTNKKFKFLHISSCFARKGIDILLEAYCKSFTAEDNICLIIKTFPNPHNNVETLIAEQKLSNENCPEIELINEDLDDSYIVDLYKKCNCLVAPSRGEGFGLPMAEAMLFDMPVITTGFGGQTDFCNDDTSWLIDFSFQKAQTHMNLFNSYWVEPCTQSLSELLIQIYSLPEKEIKEKTKKAKENIMAYHKWEDSAKRIMDTVESLELQPVFFDKTIKLGWISSYNTKCGIATYSKFLLDNFSKNNFEITILANYVNKNEIFEKNLETNVIRSWKDASDNNLDKLFDEIISRNLTIIFFQFNFGFFNIYALGKLIDKLHEKKIKIFITFHSVKDVNKDDFNASLSWINSSLKKVERLFVHGIEDLNVMKSFNLIENVSLFPHGVMKKEAYVFKIKNLKEELFITNKRIIASYGFMLPHKGIKELIEAFRFVKDNYKNTHLLLINAIYPIQSSEEYAYECKQIINKLNLSNDITLINDFLSDEESLSYLDCADMIVLPYKETQESSSASVRYAISTNKPVICTPISIFDDVSDIVHFSEDNTINSLAKKISELLDNEILLNSKKEIQMKWIEEHNWLSISNRLSNIMFNKLKEKY